MRVSEESEGLQLSNQEYSVCVRHERGFCGISYTACQDTDRCRVYTCGNTAVDA